MPTEGKVDLEPKRFVTEGQVDLTPEVPSVPQGLVPSRVEDRLSIDRYSKAMLDVADPTKASVTARLAPALPVFYKDITRIPEIAKAAAAGVVESATMGLAPLPDLPDETVPMRIARIAGQFIGAAAPLPLLKAAPLGRLGKAALGAELGVLAAGAKRVLRPEDEHSDTWDLINAGMLGVMGAMLGPIGAKDVVEKFVMKQPLEEARKAGAAVRAGRLQKTAVPQPQYTGQMALYQRAYSEREAELVQTFKSIVKNTPRGEIDFGHLRDLAKRAARGEPIGNNVTIEPTELADIGKGVVRPKVVPIRPPAESASPELRLRNLNAEIDARAGVGAVVETRATAGGASRPLKGTVRLPDGKIITEAEALNRRGRPARPPVEPDEVETFVGAKNKVASRILYRHKASGQQAGSTTYVKLKPDSQGGRYFTETATPEGVKLSPRYVPIELGDEAEFMVTEINPAQGFSDYIIRDLRGRGIRFVKADRPTIKGLLKRHHAKQIGETDVYELETLHSVRGGLGDEASGMSQIISEGAGRSFGRQRTAMLSAWRPTAPIMRDLEEVDGIPYYRMFSAVEDARETAREAAYDMSLAAFRKIRGWSKTKRQAGLDFLVGTPQQRSAARLAPEDLATLESLKTEILNPLWGQWFKTDFDDYAIRVVSDFRQRGVNAASETLPRKFAKIKDFTEGMRLNLLERDLAKFLNQHIHTGAFSVHAGPTISEATKFTERTIIPTDTKNMLRNYLRGWDGTDDAFVNRTLAPLYQGFWKLLGKDVSEFDARNIISTYSALTHAGTLGFRVGPLIRNVFGGIQTGAPRIGIKWYAEGMKQSLTREGIELFKRSGIPKEAASVIDRLDEISSSRPTAFVTKTARIAMWPYAKIDLFPRAHAYLGGRASLLSAAKRFGREATDEVVFDATRLWNFHPVIRREVMALYREGKFSEAAHLFGQHAQMDTQWVYRTGFRPENLRSEIGHALGTFGVWPLNYLEYFRQMALPAKFGGLPNMPAKAKALWIGEWLAVNSAIVGAFAGVGTTVGMGLEAAQHTLGWTFFGPLSYGGGPLVEFVPGVAGMMSETLKGKPVGQQTSRALRAIQNMVPGYGLYRDVRLSVGKRTHVEVPRRRGRSRYEYDRTVTETPRNVFEFLFRAGTGAQRKPTP